MGGVEVSEVPALPPLVHGEYPQLFTDEDFERLETERIRRSLNTHTQGNAEVIQRLDSLSADMERVMSVISQLETLIAQIMPAVDQITENPAKFLMSLMGGGRGGR